MKFSSNLFRCSTRTYLYGADPELAYLTPRPVHEDLLEYVEEYFRGDGPQTSDKVHMTSLPPIYFQHPGMEASSKPVRRRGETDSLQAIL